MVKTAFSDLVLLQGSVSDPVNLSEDSLVMIKLKKHLPAALKPLDEVRRFAHELAWSLVKDYGVKAVVVACNTATAAGLDELRDELPVPVIDVVAPGARALVTTTVTGRVGVIGTVGTLLGNAGVNISDMDVSRVPGSDTAVMLIAPSAPVPGDVLDDLRER